MSRKINQYVKHKAGYFEANGIRTDFDIRYKLSSSDGDIFADKDGSVVVYKRCLSVHRWMSRIVKVDLSEYRKFYGYMSNEDIPADLDLMDVRFQWDDGSWRDANETFREEVLEYEEARGWATEREGA